MSSDDSFSSDLNNKNNQTSNKLISDKNKENNESTKQNLPEVTNNEKEPKQNNRLQRKGSMKNLTLEKDKIKVSNNYFSLFNNKNSNERQQTKKDTIRNVPSFKSKKNINLPFKTSLQGGQSDSKKNVRKTFFRQSTFVNKNSNNDIEEEDLIKETKLEKLQKKTAELEEELKTKQQEMEIEKNNSCQIVIEMNLSIDENQKKIIKLNKDNKKLMKELKEIKNEVNNKFKLIKIFDIKRENLNDVENNLQKTLKKREKEIEIQKNIHRIVKKEKERYKQLLKSKDTSATADELNDLNKEIISIQNQIKMLTKLKEEHKNCIKEINNLSNKYNIIKNDYEFEQKKLNMANNVEITNNKSLIKANSNDYIIERRRNQKKLIENKLRNKKNIKMKMFLKNSIWNELDSAHEKHVITLCNIKNNKNKNLIKNVSVDNMRLFTEEENQVLKKIIPKNILESYQSKFETIGYKRKEVVQKFKQNDFMKKGLQQAQDRIDFSSLQMKENKKREMQLKCDVIKYRKKINDITVKINSINNLIKEQKKLYNVKNKEYKRILVHVQNMENKIKNGEVIKKKAKKEKKTKK